MTGTVALHTSRTDTIAAEMLAALDARRQIAPVTAQAATLDLVKPIRSVRPCRA